MTQPQLQIRALQNEEVSLFRDLRLQALKEAPEAFEQRYEVENEKPMTYWQELVDALTSPSKHIMLMAYFAETCAGVVYGFNKGSGNGSFGGMWVAKTHRKQGVGIRLVEEIFEWAKSREISTLHIWNMEGNLAAQNLYEKAGFQPTGVRKDLETQPSKRIVQYKKEL